MHVENFRINFEKTSLREFVVPLNLITVIPIVIGLVITANGAIPAAIFSSASTSTTAATAAHPRCSVLIFILVRAVLLFVILVLDLGLVVCILGTVVRII